MTPRDEAPVTLADCLPGLFETLEGHWGFKTEYAHKNESDGRYYPEAYVVDSGEFFWGGAADHAERAKLLVRPLDTGAIRHRTQAAAAAKAREEGFKALAVDDPNWICAGIPDAVIEAGMDAQDKVRHDMENYVSGVTPDWDDGMVVAAIFKAMLRAALSASDGEADK